MVNHPNRVKRSKKAQALAEAAVRALAHCQGKSDTESNHSTADEALCTLLRGLGYGDVVDEWERVEKWYA